MLLYVFTAEDNNTRVLFEKAVSSVPSDKARLASYYIVHVYMHYMIFFTCIASLHMYLHVYRTYMYKQQCHTCIYMYVHVYVCSPSHLPKILTLFNPPPHPNTFTVKFGRNLLNLSPVLVMSSLWSRWREEEQLPWRTRYYGHYMCTCTCSCTLIPTSFVILHGAKLLRRSRSLLTELWSYMYMHMQST